MSLTDSFCKSPDLGKEEQRLCYEFASDLHDMIADLEQKGCLRSELKSKQGEEDRKHFINILWDVRKVGHAFNMFFDMYVDRRQPHTRHRLEKFLELNKPYGMTERDLAYLLFSEMIFIFLQNAEEFRTVLLFIMKLPICYFVKRQKREITRKTGLGTLLWGLSEMGIKKTDALLTNIDYNLRNGLSHGLYWFDEKGDSEHSEPHLHYSKDITFQDIDWISTNDLFFKTRHQTIYTNCLLNVIADWFL